MVIAMGVLAALPAMGAEAYRAGDALDAFTVNDQHEKPFTFTAGATRVILVTFDMPSGKKANAWLSAQPADLLDKHQAVFLSNIYGMPGVGRFFALPKMKKYPHRILLGDDEHLLDRYPKQDGKLTVLRVDAQGKIEAVSFVDPEAGLAAVFARS